MNAESFKKLMAKARGRDDPARAGLETQLMFRPPQFGRAHGSDLRVALVGRPNAGCSTLFNALTGRHVQASCFFGETRKANRGRAANVKRRAARESGAFATTRVGARGAGAFLNSSSRNSGESSGPGSAGDADVRLARELLRAQGAAAGDLRVNRCPRGGVAVRALPEGSRADVRRGRAEFRGDLRRDARGLRRGCSAETASRRTPAALRRGSLRGDVSGLSDAGATSRCRRCPTARRVRRF